MGKYNGKVTTTTNPHNMRLEVARIERKLKWAEAQEARAKALRKDRDALVAAIARWTPKRG